MSELTKKRVHWTEYNGDELLHDEDVDVLTSADAVTFDDGEDLQYKYTKGQFVNPSVTGSLSSLSTTNKSSLVDAINEVKTNSTSNESSIDSLTDRVSTTEIDIDNLEARMDTAESDVDSLKTRVDTTESDIDDLESRMNTAESGIDDLENRITPISLGGTGATTVTGALKNLQIYNGVDQLGLTYPCTTVDIIKAMPTNSEVKIAINSRSGSITDLPEDFCLLTVRYDYLNRYQIFCTQMTSSGSSGTYIGNYVRNTSISWEKIATGSNISDFKAALVDMLYPIGSIHMSVNSENPSTYFGGTWVSWGAGRVPVGVNTSDSSFSTVEKTGGEKTHTLTIDEMPAHTHTYTGMNPFGPASPSNSSTCSTPGSGPTGSTGGSQPHNNLQPYITCYMWKRTA